ncbi:MAG: YfhO family protein [Bacilli bacterium]|nr:YfhO family protein [Bacilli bacterium]
MKKYSKQDYINIIIIIASFFAIFIFTILYNGTSYASKIDFSYQHYMIPEYFRKLFYETKQLFPSYAFNLGMGQNIYNFSYYGLLSPTVLLSYLLPFIKMKIYIQIVTIILYLISIFLCYTWIGNKVENKRIRFISTFLYAMSGPLILHTHRHIMFINYMPFLFMGLFGIERYIKERKPVLLIISNLLIITSSYFFSVPTLIMIFIYAIYLYIENNKKIKIKEFIKTHLITAWYFIIPVLISGVLLLPSLKAILDNRYKEAAKKSLLSYLIPKVSFDNVLYTSYSMGLTAILIVSIIHLIIKKNKANRFLSIVFTCLLCLPIVNYTLNGFMYLNGKVFIPFIPLGLLLISITLKDFIIDKEKVSKLLIALTIIISILGCIKYHLSIIYIIDILSVLIGLFIGQKYNKNILIIILIIVSTFNCVRLSICDDFNKLSVAANQYDSNIKELLSDNGTSIYRTVDLTNKSFNSNNIRSINEYKTTMYSSVTNKYYKDFYWNTFDTDNPNRNDAIFSDISNPLFNIYFGNKYLVGDSAPIGYVLVTNKNGINLYKNNNVFSIGYATDKLMSKEEFEKLEYPYSIEALLKYTIVDKDIDSEYKSDLKKMRIKNSFNKQIEGDYELDLEEDEDYTVKSLKDLEGKIVIIKFDMNYSQSCEEGDTYITINGVKNVLTCKSWKYHNNNYSFTYVISEPNKVNIEVEEGKYDISDVEIYAIDYDEIKNIKSTHDEFIIDSAKGDIIKGHINVQNEGYFSLSIPYDKGYNIYVDGKKTNYEKVNKSFIGFRIDLGDHNIMIKYTAPWLKIGKITSIIGLCLLTVTIVFNKGVKRHEKNINDSTLL